MLGKQNKHRFSDIFLLKL